MDKNEIKVHNSLELEWAKTRYWMIAKNDCNDFWYLGKQHRNNHSHSFDKIGLEGPFLDICGKNQLQSVETGASQDLSLDDSLRWLQWCLVPQEIKYTYTWSLFFRNWSRRAIFRYEWQKISYNSLILDPVGTWSWKKMILTMSYTSEEIKK